MATYSRSTQCVSKRQYETRSEANATARKMRENGQADSRLHAYRCPHCGWFHIGNYPERKST
jgi:rubrerythrin